MERIVKVFIHFGTSGKIRSITTDNGSEFAEHMLIAKRLKPKCSLLILILLGKKDALNITTN